MATNITLTQEKISNLEYKINYSVTTVFPVVITKIECSNGKTISHDSPTLTGSIIVTRNDTYTITVTSSDGAIATKTITISGITRDPKPSAPKLDFTPKYNSTLYPIITENVCAVVTNNYDTLYPNSSGTAYTLFRVLVNNVNTANIHTTIIDGVEFEGWVTVQNDTIGPFINNYFIPELEDGTIKFEVMVVTNQAISGTVGSYTFKYYKHAYDDTLKLVEEAELLSYDGNSDELQLLVTKGLKDIGAVPNYNLSPDFNNLRDRLLKLQELIDKDFTEDLPQQLPLTLNTVFLIDKSTNMSTDGRIDMLNSGMEKMIQRLKDMQKNYSITVTARLIFFGPSSIQQSSQLNINYITWSDVVADGTNYLAPAVNDMMNKVLDVGHFPSKVENGNLRPIFILYSSGNIDDETEYNKYIAQFDETYWGKNGERIAISVNNPYQPVLDTWENGNTHSFDINNPDDGLGDIVGGIIRPNMPTDTNNIYGSLVAQGLEDSLVENKEDFFIKASNFGGKFPLYSKLQYKISFGILAAGKTIQIKRKDGYLMSVTLNSKGSATFNPVDNLEYFYLFQNPELATEGGMHNLVMIDFDKGKYVCKLTLMRFNTGYDRYFETTIGSSKSFIVNGPPIPYYIYPDELADFIKVPDKLFSIGVGDPTKADKYVDVKLYINSGYESTTRMTYNYAYSVTGSNAVCNIPVSLRNRMLGKYTWRVDVSNQFYSVSLDPRIFTISLGNPVLTVTGRDKFQETAYTDITSLSSNIECAGIYNLNVELKYGTYFYLDINGETQVEELQNFSDPDQDSKYESRVFTKTFDMPGTYNVNIVYRKGDTEYTKSYKIIIKDYPVSLNSPITSIEKYNIPELDPDYAEYNILSLDNLKEVTTATMKSGTIVPFSYFLSGSMTVNNSYFNKLDDDRYQTIKIGTTSVTLQLVKPNQTLSATINVTIKRYVTSLYTMMTQPCSIEKYVWGSITLNLKYSDGATSTIDYTKLSVSKPDNIEIDVSTSLLRARSLKKSSGIIQFTYPKDDNLIKFPGLFSDKLLMNFVTADKDLSVYAVSYNVFDGTSSSNTYTAGQLAVMAVSCDGQHKINITSKYADYIKITRNNVNVLENSFDIDTSSYSNYTSYLYTDTVDDLGIYVYHIELGKNTGDTISYDISVTVTDYVVDMNTGTSYDINKKTGEIKNVNYNASLPNEYFHVDSINNPTVNASEMTVFIKMKSGYIYDYDTYMSKIGTHLSYYYSDTTVVFSNSIVNFTSYDIPPGNSLYKTLTIRYNRPHKILNYIAAFIFTPNVIGSITGRKKFDESSYTDITSGTLVYKGIYSLKTIFNYAKSIFIYVNGNEVYRMWKDFDDTSTDSSYTQSSYSYDFDEPGFYNVQITYTSKKGMVYDKQFNIDIEDYPISLSPNNAKTITRYPIPLTTVGYEEYNTVAFEGYIKVTMKSGKIYDFDEVSGYGTNSQTVNSNYLYKLPEGNYACITHGVTNVVYKISRPYYTLQTTLTVNILRYATDFKLQTTNQLFIDKYQWSNVVFKIVYSNNTSDTVYDCSMISVRADDNTAYRITPTNGMKVTGVNSLPGMMEFTYPVGEAPFFDGIFNNKVELFVWTGDEESKLILSGCKSFDTTAYEIIDNSLPEVSYDGTYKLKIKTQCADALTITRDGTVVYQYKYDLDKNTREDYLSKESEYIISDLGKSEFIINIVRNTGIAESPDNIDKTININITDYAVSLHDGYIGTFPSMTIDGIKYPAIGSTINEYFVTCILEIIGVNILQKLVIRMKSGAVYDYLTYMNIIGLYIKVTNTDKVIFNNNQFFVFNEVPTVNYAEFNYSRPYYKLSYYRVAFLGTPTGTYVLRLLQSNNFEIDRITFVWDASLNEAQSPEIMRTSTLHLSNEIIDEEVDVLFSNGRHIVDSLVPGNRFDATLTLKYTWNKQDGTKSEISITSDVIQPITRPIDFGHNVITITPYEDEDGPTFLYLVDWTYPTQVINKDISFYNVSIYDKIPVEVVWDYTDKPTSPIEIPDDDISDNDTLLPIGVKQYKVGDKECSVDDSSYLLNPFDPLSIWEYRWLTVKSLIEYGTDYVIVEK